MSNTVLRFFIRFLPGAVITAGIMCLSACLSAAPKPALSLPKGIDPTGPAAEIITVFH